MIPGEIICSRESITLNEGLKTKIITAENTGTRPIQVGAHFHFFEANRALAFDRGQAYGFRPDIPSGTAVRFEPGEKKEVALVEIRGKRLAFGLNNLTDAQINDHTRDESLHKAQLRGFCSKGEGDVCSH